LLFGVIILAVLIISFLAPGEIAYSILTTETEKEKPLQQLEKILKRIADGESVSSNPEKLKLEKSIIELRKEIQQEREKAIKNEGNREEILQSFHQKRYDESRLRIR